MIRTVNNEDASSIVEIYNYYISETAITFEENIVTSQNIQERITKTNKDNLPWLVATDESGTVIGYAYASQWKERFSYRFSVEVTVYLTPLHSNKGIGSQLYEALFADLKLKSIHTVIGGITLPNPASVGLHEKFGMVKIAHFKEVGYKFKQWQDVGYWQGIL